MKKIWLSILFIVAFVNAFCQFTRPNPGSYGTIVHRIAVDSAIMFPTGCGDPTLKSVDIHMSALYADTCSHLVWWYDPAQLIWDTLNKAGASGGAGANNYPTAFTYNGTTLTITRNGLGALTVTLDTALMLSKYLRKIDTASLSTRINQKINYSDTNDLFATRTWVTNNFFSSSGITFADGLLKSGSTVTALHDNALWNARQWQGFPISPAQPVNGQIPIFDGSCNCWMWGSQSGGGGGGGDSSVFNFYLLPPLYKVDDSTAGGHFADISGQDGFITSADFINFSNKVSTVTGDAVDNSDPLNPVINVSGGNGIYGGSGTLLSDIDIGETNIHGADFVADADSASSLVWDNIARDVLTTYQDAETGWSSHRESFPNSAFFGLTNGFTSHQAELFVGTPDSSPFVDDNGDESEIAALWAGSSELKNAFRVSNTYTRIEGDSIEMRPVGFDSHVAGESWILTDPATGAGDWGTPSGGGGGLGGLSIYTGDSIISDATRTVDLIPNTSQLLFRTDNVSGTDYGLEIASEGSNSSLLQFATSSGAGLYVGDVFGTLAGLQTTSSDGTARSLFLVANDAVTSQSSSINVFSDQTSGHYIKAEADSLLFHSTQDLSNDGPIFNLTDSLNRSWIWAGAFGGETGLVFGTTPITGITSVDNMSFWANSDISFNGNINGTTLEINDAANQIYLGALNGLIFETPESGSGETTDSFLVWNPANSHVKQISPSQIISMLSFPVDHGILYVDAAGHLTVSDSIKFAPSGGITLPNGSLFANAFFSHPSSLISTPGSGGVFYDKTDHLPWFKNDLGVDMQLNAFGYTAKTIDYNVAPTDFTIEVTVTGKTMTLPDAATVMPGHRITIKLTAATSTGTVATTSSQTIDGSTTYILIAQYKYVTVESNGSNWIITANN